MNIRASYIRLLILTAVATSACAVSAQEHSHPAAPTAGVAAPASAVLPVEQLWTRGVVRKINSEQRKLTIKHEALVALDMPPMTMVFTAGPAVELSGLAVGATIEFSADMADKVLTVTDLRTVEVP